MNTTKKVSRVLGWSFLLQFIGACVTGFILNPRLIVPNNITETMTNISHHIGLMKVYILIDMFTSLGIIFLGAMLFIYLRKVNEKMALVALGFYIMEAVLGAASKLDAFSLLRISQEWAMGGNPPYLLTLGKIASDSMDFVGTGLLMLAFCPGGILFYYLLFKSRIVPRGLSLWGLITVFPLLIAILLNMFGYEIPIYVLLPYVPFEGVIAIWILVKGIKVDMERKPQLAYASVIE